MEVQYFASQTEFRAWLENNHAKAMELWIGFYKKASGKGGITYPQAVDEALCFGWIDGIRKSVDGDSFTNRFTPRKRSSNWSAINIKRVGELTELGLMQPPGLKVFEERDHRKSQQYSFEQEEVKLDPAYEKRFQEIDAGWEFFQSQPPSYQKVAIWWVMSAKKEETRLKRLAALVEDSANGRRIKEVTWKPKSD